MLVATWCRLIYGRANSSGGKTILFLSFRPVSCFALFFFLSRQTCRDVTRENASNRNVTCLKDIHFIKSHNCSISIFNLKERTLTTTHTLSHRTSSKYVAYTIGRDARLFQVENERATQSYTAVHAKKIDFCFISLRRLVSELQPFKDTASTSDSRDSGTRSRAGALGLFSCCSRLTEANDRAARGIGLI